MKKIFLLSLVLSLSFSSAFAYTQTQLFSAQKLATKWIIVKQLEESQFRLDDTITRKEFMKVVGNIVGEQIEDSCNKMFEDVPNDWGCKYIEWALEKSYIARNQNFRPDDSITKAESMKLILQARAMPRIQNSGDWREDDMKTAFNKWIISTEYTDYDTYATRGWIFEAVVTEIGTYGSGWWVWDDQWNSFPSSTSSSTSTSTSTSSSSSSSSSSWGTPVEIYGDDWRNKVP